VETLEIVFITSYNLQNVEIQGDHISSALFDMESVACACM
jgi:hypothetical protein